MFLRPSFPILPFLPDFICEVPYEWSKTVLWYLKGFWIPLSHIWWYSSLAEHSTADQVQLQLPPQKVFSAISFSTTWSITQELWIQPEIVFHTDVQWESDQMAHLNASTAFISKHRKLFLFHLGLYNWFSFKASCNISDNSIKILICKIQTCSICPPYIANTEAVTWGCVQLCGRMTNASTHVQLWNNLIPNSFLAWFASLSS